MRMCGRQGGKENQSLRKPLGRVEGLPRFALDALLISLVVLSIPGLLTAQQTQQLSAYYSPTGSQHRAGKEPGTKAALADTRAASADVKERDLLLPHVTFRDGHPRQ